MATNVKAYYVSASTTLTDAGGRLRGLNIVGNGTAALGKVVSERAVRPTAILF